MVTTVMVVMTVHVLHAGDGYLYLIRSVAAHDGRLAAGASLVAYYTASGQPPGRWAGEGARRLAVTGTVTEEQMRSLFGEGLYPNAAAMREAMVATGMSEREAVQATRLGRRFPQYGTGSGLRSLAHRAYESRASYNAPAWELDAWVSTYTAIAQGELALITGTVEDLVGRPALTLREFLTAETA